MQTFLPYKSFIRSAQCLDRQRLGKQRVEGLQILLCLIGSGCQQWKNHPAVKMWRGYELSLVAYVREICYEWKQRGYKDSVEEKVNAIAFGLIDNGQKFISPPWLGMRKFHRAHQSNFVRKDENYYRKFFKTVQSDLPYVWPIQ